MATKVPSVALLVAIAFIVTLQQANKLRLYDTSLSVASPGETSWLPSVSGESVESEMQMPGELVNDVNQVNGVDESNNSNSVEQHQQVNHTNEVPQMDSNVHDQAIARESMPSATVHDVVENMVPSQVEGLATNAASVGEFTSESQFNDAQSNAVPGSNQESCVSAFNNQYCAQGLQSNVPNGHN